MSAREQLPRPPSRASARLLRALMVVAVVIAATTIPRVRAATEQGRAADTIPAPQLSAITATFMRPVTTYTITVTLAPGDTAQYSWSKVQVEATCGVFTFSGNTAQWSHPDASLGGDCPDEVVHPGTIYVTVTASQWNCGASYPFGSAAGTGPQQGSCVPGTRSADTATGTATSTATMSPTPTITGTGTGLPTITATATATGSPTIMATKTATATGTSTNSPTRTTTLTPTRSPTPTLVPSETETPTPTTTPKALIGRLWITGTDADRHCLDSNVPPSQRGPCHYLDVAIKCVRGLLRTLANCSPFGVPSFIAKAKVLVVSHRRILWQALLKWSRQFGLSRSDLILVDPRDPKKGLPQLTRSVQLPGGRVPVPLFSAILVAADVTCEGKGDLNEKNSTPDTDYLKQHAKQISDFYHSGGGVLSLAGCTHSIDRTGKPHQTFYDWFPEKVIGIAPHPGYIFTDLGRRLGLADPLDNPWPQRHNDISSKLQPGTRLRTAETELRKMPTPDYESLCTCGPGLPFVDNYPQKGNATFTFLSCNPLVSGGGAPFCRPPPPSCNTSVPTSSTCNMGLQLVLCNPLSDCTGLGSKPVVNATIGTDRFQSTAVSECGFSGGQPPPQEGGSHECSGYGTYNGQTVAWVLQGSEDASGIPPAGAQLTIIPLTGLPTTYSWTCARRCSVVHVHG